MEEVRSFLLLSFDLEFITEDAYQSLEDSYEAASKMLNGLNTQFASGIAVTQYFSDDFSLDFDMQLQRVVGAETTPTYLFLNLDAGIYIGDMHALQGDGLNVLIIKWIPRLRLRLKLRWIKRKKMRLLKIQPLVIVLKSR